MSLVVGSMVLALAASGLQVQGSKPTMAVSSEFACDLYRELAAGEGNLLFSPYSISVVLAMAREGAAGKTLVEMDRVLRSSDETAADNARLRRALSPRKVTEYVDDKRKLVPVFELDVANAVWAQKGYQFQEPFTRTLATLYKAPLERIDFSNTAAARKRINSWVEEHTHDKIKNIVPEGMPKPDTRMALANAIYFKAAWNEPFEKSATKKAPFHVSGDKRVDVDMMHMITHVPYAEADGLQILELPYKGEDTSMVIVLPRKTDGLAAVEKQLTGPQLGKWIGKLSTQKVSVKLPRFKFTYARSLVDDLKALGMREAFSTHADFTRMTDEERLMITAVLHKAFIAVDEAGTEAAAATVAMMAPTGIDMTEPKQFVADRPFFFVIRHRKTGCLLFAGRVAKP